MDGKVVGSLAMVLVALWLAPARAQETYDIQRLLKEKWQITGFTAPGDNRSSFILFRHPERLFLVKCRVGYDVTRKERRYVNCYTLR